MHDKNREEIEKLLRECNIQAPPVPIDTIAKRLGARIQRAPLPDDLSGLVYREGPADEPIIGVNSLHPKVRQRFTVAHEIAHLWLHKETTAHVDRGFILYFRNKSSSKGDTKEIHANKLAAELLIPERFIKNDIEQHTVDFADEEILSILANRYQVSIQTMVYRLINLGYLESV